MADTWGDVLGRNYAVGREFGEDLATMRFQRNAAKVREEYEERARTEQKPLDSYLPEIEQRLQEVARKVGATRRGVMGRGGQSLDAAYGANLRDEFGRLGQREAATQEMAGDFAGAQGTLGRNAANRGDYAGAQQAALTRDSIGATSAAMGPDGQYDMAKGAQGLAGIAAQRGMSDAANAQQTGATTFRLQAATAIGDQLQRVFTNPQMASPDRVRGLFANFKGNVPELGDTDVQVADDGKWIIYQNGKATGSLDPNDPNDVAELNSMLTAFTQAPGQAVQGLYASRLKSIEDSKKMDSETAKRYSEARISAIQKLSESTDLPKEILTKMFGDSGSGSGGSGWQLQEIGEDPSTYMVRVGGETFVVKTNVAGADGLGGGTVQVTTADGKPVPASAMDRAVRNDITRTVSVLGRELAKGNYEAKANAIRTQLEMLNSLESQERGRPTPGISRDMPAEAGQIQSQYDELGKKHGFETTSTTRSPEENRKVGGVENSQHLDTVGTARDWSVKGKTPEQIEAFAADLRNAGYEVITRNHGTGPHIHAELPPGARRVAAAASAPAQTQSAPSAPGNVVAGGSDVRPPGKPAATAPQRPTGISREGVLAAKANNDQNIQIYTAAKNALERFDQEQGVQMGWVPGGNDRSGGQTGPTNLTPAQAQVRARLVADLSTAQERMEGSAEDTRSSAQALRRKVALAQSSREAQELYSKYGSAADFVKSSTQ